MKKITPLLLLLVMVCSSFVYYGDRGNYAYTPVFMDKSDLERSVSYQSGGREMRKPGKIYYKSPYIYVNERYKGVHVINNSNPANPVKEGFIAVPGCMDMAVKGNILYVDNSTDLVAFDLNTKQVTGRVKGVFPEPVAPDNTSYDYYHSRPDNSVLVEWKRKN